MKNFMLLWARKAPHFSFIIGEPPPATSDFHFIMK